MRMTWCEKTGNVMTHSMLSGRVYTTAMIRLALKYISASELVEREISHANQRPKCCVR
jgi:hypothetical protein